MHWDVKKVYCWAGMNHLVGKKASCWVEKRAEVSLRM